MDSSSRIPQQENSQASNARIGPSTHACSWWILGRLATVLMIESAQLRRIKIEVEDQAEELKMADGTMVKTEGRVQFVLKCGGYRGQISARVFPNMNKPMILGIPWLLKEFPHIDWTQSISGSKQGSSMDLPATFQAPAIKPSPSSQ